MGLFLGRANVARPLIAAMAFGSFEVVKLLLDAKARPEQRMRTDSGQDSDVYS